MSTLFPCIVYNSKESTFKRRLSDNPFHEVTPDTDEFLIALPAMTESGIDLFEQVYNDGSSQWSRGLIRTYMDLFTGESPDMATLSRVNMFTVIGRHKDEGYLVNIDALLQNLERAEIYLKDYALAVPQVIAREITYFNTSYSIVDISVEEFGLPHIPPVKLSSDYIETLLEVLSQ